MINGDVIDEFCEGLKRLHAERLDGTTREVRRKADRDFRKSGFYRKMKGFTREELLSQALMCVKFYRDAKKEEANGTRDKDSHISEG